MITEDVKEFSKSFHDELRADAHGLNALRETVFVQKMGDILEEYGEIEALMPCQYKGRGVKVDGYSFDDEFKDFILVVSHFKDEEDPSHARVNNTDINQSMKKVSTFFTKCLGGYHDQIDISNPAHDLAKLIYECRKEVRNVKFVLITDGHARRRASEVEEIEGVDVTRTVWDIERTCHFYRTGERETISMEFPDHCGGPLECVVEDSGDGIYTTYLGFMPGTALADMYALWGIKMLDMNVRVFLSARGNVNKGIRKTIKESPEMFCAYNNGITVFAREVTLTEDGKGLINAKDFQIVNGGQTTASLYHTRKKDRADLKKIQVQMKLTVIHDESKIEKLVPLISEFSNTQNKVQTADLAANEAPHPEIQEISKRLLAPDPTGGSFQTNWFYERARGSYEEFRSLTARTPHQKKHFDSINPKKQKFDKIKFAKVWNSYLRMPHTVSLGGQKNFGRFNQWLREQKDEDWVSFFRKTVALLLLWNETERMVRRKKFQGYHHNIVAYSLSWFFYLTGSRIDLEKIWQEQKVAASILDTLDGLSDIVDTHIRNTTYNVTEYCKKKDCWEKLLEGDGLLATGIEDEYLANGGNNGGYEVDTSGEEKAIDDCINKGAQAWFELSKWLRERDFLPGRARSQCYNMGRTINGKKKKPSAVLSIACLKVWSEAELRGWSLPIEE